MPPRSRLGPPLLRCFRCCGIHCELRARKLAAAVADCPQAVAIAAGSAAIPGRNNHTAREREEGKVRRRRRRRGEEGTHLDPNLDVAGSRANAAITYQPRSQTRLQHLGRTTTAHLSSPRHSTNHEIRGWRGREQEGGYRGVAVAAANTQTAPAAMFPLAARTPQPAQHHTNSAASAETPSLARAFLERERRRKGGGGRGQAGSKWRHPRVKGGEKAAAPFSCFSREQGEEGLGFRCV